MRIVYLLPDPGIGLFGTKGASVHAQEMIRAFQTMGHEVIVCCTKRGNRAGDPTSEAVPSDLRNLPVITVPVTGAKGAAKREVAISEATNRMATLMAEESVDLIYERYSLFSTAGAQLAQRTGAPLVVEVNAPLVNEQQEHRSLHNAAVAEQTTLATFQAATLISCVSTPVAQWVQEQLVSHHASSTPPATDHQGRACNTLTMRPPEVIVTPNGVDPQRFRPVSSGSHAATAKHPKFTVGFLGTLKPWHGTETLLQALALVPAVERSQWRCEIIGDGPERKQLQQLSEELGLTGQVHFRGALAPDQVPAALATWDTAVAPYPHPEKDTQHYFSPMKVYEYFAAGLPVVASKVGELPSLIHDGLTGLLVPGSDPSRLAGCLQRLAADPQLRLTLGSAARHYAVTENSWVSRAQGVLEAVAAQEVHL